MKSKGHLAFQCTNDYWGTRLDEGMPGALLSCNVVAIHGFSSHSCVTKKLKPNVVSMCITASTNIC